MSMRDNDTVLRSYHDPSVSLDNLIPLSRRSKKTAACLPNRIQSRNVKLMRTLKIAKKKKDAQTEHLQASILSASSETIGKTIVYIPAYIRKARAIRLSYLIRH